MLAARDQPFATREDVERDANAALAFDDGTRVPCDKFVMRAFCAVVSDLLSATQEVRDGDRVLVPVPGQDPPPFWTAVDVLHGVKAPDELDDAAEVESVLKALDFLGCKPSCGAQAELSARLWQLVAAESDLDAILDHAPRLLRVPGYAGPLVAALTRRRPVWLDFLRDVLLGIEERGQLDARDVCLLVQHAQGFFPPALPLRWALTERVTPRLVPDDAARLACQSGEMFHPCELPGVLRFLRSTFRARQLDSEGRALPLLDLVLRAVQRYEAVPLSANRVHGSFISFDKTGSGAPCDSACACFPPARRLPGAIRLARWLRASFEDEEGALAAAYDVRFDARRVGVGGHRTLELRVSCTSGPREDAFAEAWYAFCAPAGGGVLGMCSLADARHSFGSPGSVAALLAQRGSQRLLRLDFFEAVAPKP